MSRSAVAEDQEIGPASRRSSEGEGRPPSGRFAYDGLDRILHEKARLGIMASLLSHPSGLLFNDLKALCALTDGNLSRHLQVLSGASLVEIWKSHDRRPQTLCRLSAHGRERFLAYLEELERVLNDASALTALQAQDIPAGWAPA